MSTYGYCRISRKEQSITRQVRNITAVYPDAIILEEAFTGTRMDRPTWTKLYRKLIPGDLVVFDSVSRMSRTEDEGVEIYFELYEKGIQLVFLNEPQIDTETYDSAIKQSIPATGNDIADIYIEATNKVIRLLAEKQIRKAFEQSEKEVQDLRKRTREGIQTARLAGKQIGSKKGSVYLVKKAISAKKRIIELNKSFGGSLSDVDCISLLGISRNTFYKYKRELLSESNQQ